MNLEGQKISGSRNWAVWGLDFLTRYDPDPLRYYLTANMPESKDTDWDWEDFYNRNNDELVATWGNLANRVLSFAYKNWEGVVPDARRAAPARSRDPGDGRSRLRSGGRAARRVRLRAALGEAMRLATEVNKYLDTAAPWFEIKSDRTAAATHDLHRPARDRLAQGALRALPALHQRAPAYLPGVYPAIIRRSRLWKPTATALGEHTVLRYQPGASQRALAAQPAPAGQALKEPAPLFRKLEEKIVEEERARLG